MPNLTDEQFERLITTLRPPVDTEAEAKKAAEKAEKLEDQKRSALVAKAQDDEKAAIKARCNHMSGSALELGKRGGTHLTQGKSQNSALVLVRHTDPSKEFIICQHCADVTLQDSPFWAERFEVAA
jgi:hypothetical protein